MSVMIIPNAFAQGSAPKTPEMGFMSFLPMVVIFVLFYFLLIRPQQKRTKEHKAMLAALQTGDEVVSSGGLAGKVDKVDEQFITLEISDNVKVLVQRSAVNQRLEKGYLKKYANEGVPKKLNKDGA